MLGPGAAYYTVFRYLLYVHVLAPTLRDCRRMDKLHSKQEASEQQCLDVLPREFKPAVGRSLACSLDRARHWTLLAYHAEPTAEEMAGGE